MMMHQIAQGLTGCNQFFTPFFADGFLSHLGKSGLLDFTILGGRHRKNTLRYLRENHLQIDEEGKKHPYDLIVTCTDLITQRILQETPVVLVQEGIMEDENWTFPLVKNLKLPRYLANTAATGLSDQYEVFCVASEGYQNLFVHKGVKSQKIAVTGIPTFDNVKSYLQNDFPFKDFVYVKILDQRETFKSDNRVAFLKKVKRLAAEKPIIVKLHPNENISRAFFEIQRYLPQALILVEGNINPMIANCEVLITQYSTVTFTGLLLGKQVYSCLDIEKLKTLLPQQNGGKSAQRIAAICQDLLTKPKLLRENPRSILRQKTKLSFFRN